MNTGAVANQKNKPKNGGEKLSKSFEKISHCFRSCSTKLSSALLSNITFRRARLCQVEGEGDLLSVRLYIYIYIHFWYAARSSVSQFFMSFYGEYDFRRIAFPFHLLLRQYFLFGALHPFPLWCTFRYVYRFKWQRVCWIFNNDTTAQFYGDEQNAMSDKKNANALSTVHIHFYKHTHTHHL